MARPDYEDSIAGDNSDADSNASQTLLGPLTHGAENGQIVGRVTESAAGSVFATKDESKDADD
jgi:hypothetical protein